MTLQVISLQKTFPGGIKALDGITLTLDSDAFTVLSGHNGSGKSLLVRHLLGLEKQDAGSITVDGLPLSGCLGTVRGRVALVFQEPEHQILGVTVREDVAFTPVAAGMVADGKAGAGLEPLVVSVLEATGLAGFENRLCSALSGGEKRRLAIASALAAGPQLLILDEPFNGLDWGGASDLLGILLDLRAKGVGILVVTHDLEKCLAHADRLVVLDRGRVVRDAHPAALWADLPELGLRRPSGGPEALRNMTWLKGQA